MFLLASAFYCYEFLLQVFPAILAQQLMRDLHINATMLGVISDAYFYSYTIMQIPSGLLHDKPDARRVTTVAIMFCAVDVLLFGISNAFVACASLRKRKNVKS